MLSKTTVRRWRVLKARLLYLSYTLNYGVSFRKRHQVDRKLRGSFKIWSITASSEAGWASDKNDRWQIIGGMITCNGITVGFNSMKRSAVALSEADAEYWAITDIIQREIYPQTLTLKFTEQPATLIVENDNMHTLDMKKALGVTKQSKFIDMRHTRLIN